MTRTTRHAPDEQHGAPHRLTVTGPARGTGRHAASPARAAPTPGCPVNSHTEWDPLEEVIVGRLEHATIPTSHVTVTSNVARALRPLFALVGGLRYPSAIRAPAQRELDGFIALLEREGIRVRRPDPVDHRRRFRTPRWSSRGFCSACPRDGFLVLGDEILETPMAWPSRHFEADAYRSLFKEYFASGARWSAAPRPTLGPELFDHRFTAPKDDEPLRYVVNEHEPVFDAADFVRCGRDLFAQRSNVTNHAGIEWLRRHLGERYRVHEIETRCRLPMHIDTTFMPLAPGRVLVNPAYLDVDRLPKVLRSWEILVAPQPDPVRGRLLRITSMCGEWLSMNVLMLDPRRVVVESGQSAMIKALERWGFEPLPCPFAHYAAFGGSFHCATLDVRRRGRLESYFESSSS